MSSPYPPQPPKRLERSKSNRILGGVCAGVANYLNMDPTLVRVLTVVISLFTGVPVILYIIALFVVPEEGSQPAAPTYPPVAGPQGQASRLPHCTATDSSAGVQPIGDVRAYSAVSAASTAAPAEDAVWGTEGAPWEQRQPAPGADHGAGRPRTCRSFGARGAGRACRPRGRRHRVSTRT